MKKISLILFLCIIAFSILRAEDKSVIKLIPVYEKTFQDTIVDVIFDTATVSISEAKAMGWKEEAFNEGERAKGEATISYPKVVMVSRGRELGWYAPERRNSYYTKELYFYDKKGKVLNQLKLSWEDGAEYVYLSPQKKYILVSKIPTEWKSGYSGGILYDLNGKKIWEIEGPTPIAVSDEGYAIAAYLDWQVPPESGGDFYVYDSKGKLITTIKNPLKEKTAPLFAEYSKDGEYAILSFKATTYPPTVFVLITKQGKVLWKINLPKYRFSGRYEEIDILPNKGVGIASGFFIDWQGNLKWKRSLNAGGNRGCIFSQDEKKFYIYGTKGRLYFLNVDNGGIVREHKEVWSPTDMSRLVDKVPWFVEMYEQGQNIFVKGAITNWTSWQSSKIFIFDSSKGKMKAEIEYPNKRIFLSPYNGVIFVIDAINSKVEGLKIEDVLK